MRIEDEKAKWWHKYIEECLRTGQLNDWETKAFKSIYNDARDFISPKQERLIREKYAKYVEGKSVSSYSEEYQTEYENCALERLAGNRGWVIVDNDGVQHGDPLTRKDGVTVVRWFNSYLEKRKEKRNKRKDEVPF